MASIERAEGAAATGAAAATAETGSAENSRPVSRRPGQRRHGAEGLDDPSGTTTATGSALIDGLRCTLLMNARYHASREAFLDTLHRSLMFLIIVLGAAAVTDVFGASWIKGVFSACAVVFAAFGLTADLSNRARCHALMKRRYFELLADLIADKRTPLDVEEHMHRCSADEEPAFHALLAVSWNAAQEMVYGNDADAYDVPRWHRFLKNIRRYPQAKYRVIQAPRPTPA